MFLELVTGFLQSTPRLLAATLAILAVLVLPGFALAGRVSRLTTSKAEAPLVAVAFSSLWLTLAGSGLIAFGWVNSWTLWAVFLTPAVAGIPYAWRWVHQLRPEDGGWLTALGALAVPFGWVVSAGGLVPA